MNPDDLDEVDKTAYVKRLINRRLKRQGSLKREIEDERDEIKLDRLD